MIILNKMYSGDYLEENIGHEFINEYITDDGEQYIYVNPWHDVRDLDKGDNYIIQVRYAGKNCFEVISYAKIEKNKAKDKGKSLKYGGFQLGKLLENNYISSSNTDVIYAHFKAIDFKRCRTNTYLCFDNNNSHLPDGATKIVLDGFEFGRQNSRRYVPNPKDKIEYYNDLINFINENKYWQEGKNSKLLPNEYNSAEINIIDVVGKQYEELTFSNWLAFYLRNSLLCKKFISECLKPHKIDESFLANLTLPKREYHNIDIWIESEKLVVVIENKIDSGLNGVKQTEDGKFTNQLEKYQDFAKTCAEQNNKDFYCYVIKPNYNQLTIGEKNKDWEVVEYNTILEFFDKISKDESFKDLPYIQEFVKALIPLTQTRKIDYKDIIENRLMERIATLRTEKGNK